MSFDVWPLFAGGVLYLGLLFLIAYAADTGKLPEWLPRHPVTYTLSLGVYATSWSFYGSVGFAEQSGFNFLTIYIGVTLAFLLTPLLLQPIARLTREYQISSLADLFAFRYQSQLAGVLVTLFMMAGTLPYIALQIRAVTESIQVLTKEAAPGVVALVFCVTIALFAVLFGARHISARERHEGLVVAIAFESLVKLAALVVVGSFALFGVFGGLGGLSDWLSAHPEALAAMQRPVTEGPWTTLLLLAFAAAFLLPRQFHMTFVENIDPRTLSFASWAFPLFLLLLNLAIPPILWAGQHLALTVPADYFVLGLTLRADSALLPLITFLGGISAASAMIIVTSIALAAMCMNHLVLPASFPPRLSAETDIYHWLLWGRRILIGLVIFLGYGFYLLLERNQGLAQLGLISFVAVAQFLPGIVGLLFWRRATRAGFLAGLLGGGAVWGYMLLLPLLERSGFLQIGLDPELLTPAAGDPWTPATFWSLSVNALLFAFFSLRTRPSPAERDAARACCRESVMPPGGILVADSPTQVETQLARITGEEMARQELLRAMGDLGIGPDERRPTMLRRLRERIERNLSGLVGPLLARVIVEERLQMDPEARTAMADSIRFMEQRLTDSRTRLEGLVAELDALRRYHRQVLHDLPLGVCSVGPDREVVSWNVAMARISGLGDENVVGVPLTLLPEPWSGLLAGFLRAEDHHMRKVRVQVGERIRVFNLHKAAIEDPTAGASPKAPPGAGMVILVEDLTDLHVLEAELAHSERLASIGRLAAGVAHEIGNPVTGIASLAQNLLAERGDEALLEEGLREIVQQTRRISNIVHSLVSFSHSGTAVDHSPHAVSVAECVEEAMRLLRLSRSGKFVHLVNGCDPEHRVYGDHQRLVQVFVNLLSNACDASRPEGTVEVESRVVGEYTDIVVRDYGSGIPEENVDRVFEPFFTSKQPGEGTGLGLPMVYNIVKEHSGTVTLHSRDGEGTEVRLRLPAEAGDIRIGGLEAAP